jgi:4-alpha-glucanotransferase
LLRRSFARFRSAPATAHNDFATFCGAESAWLGNFALFMALKERNGGVVWKQLAGTPRHPRSSGID